MMADIFEAKLEKKGVDDLLVKLNLTVHSMRHDMVNAVNAIGDDAELIYAAHALKRTGRLARGIKAERGGFTVLVRATARDPKSGYDYVAVTRFGHRARRIVPKRARALAFMAGGRLIFRMSTRGFHPTRDWAETAWPQIVRAGEREADKLGAKVIARFL